jgi:polyisoprenoid-binding protein YceI
MRRSRPHGAARAAGLGLLALLALAAPAAAAPRRFAPVAGSEVAFTASFPLGDFTGRTQEVSGEFRADPADLRLPVTGSLRVSAAGLRTGQDSRDRDMLKALGVERYPEILFTLDRLDSSFVSLTDRADVLLTISGRMLIRGVERPVQFPGRARLRDDRLWVRGEGEVRMSEFGIARPRHAFLEVKDTVLVRFDVTLAPEP